MTIRSYSVDSVILKTCSAEEARQLDVDHVAAPAGRPGRGTRSAPARRAHEGADDEVGRADDQGASDRGPEPGDREAVHDAPDEQEQDGIDHDYTKPHRYDDERQREEHQDGPEDRIEQAQEHDDGEQRPGVAAVDPGDQVVRYDDAERQDKPSH